MERSGLPRPVASGPVSVSYTHLDVYKRQPDEVLRSEVLTALYGTPVEVLRSGGRIFVAGAPDHAHHQGEAL